MSIDSILFYLVGIIFLSIVLAVFLAKEKSAKNDSESLTLNGTVERFGYCVFTPKGGGFWVMKLQGRAENFIINPHQVNNQKEVALITKGDPVQVKCVKNQNNEFFVMALNLKNL